MDERVFPSLGILKIAAVLEQAGIKVDVLDLSGISNFERALADYVLSNPDVIWYGITSTTPQLPAAVKVVRTIRAVGLDVTIMLGGPHITLINAAFKKERRLAKTGRAAAAMKQLEGTFDVLICGDGEDAIFQAFDENHTKFIDADENGSGLFLTNERLTELPWPARHLIDMESYHYTIEGVPALSLIAQLGCPFACGFCGGRESNMLRKIRTRTSENVVAEMVHLYQTYGTTGFMMYDDELNVNKNMVELMRLIAQAQAQLGIEWRLRGFIKSQLFTDEQAQAMYQAGFRWILVGFESGSEQILLAINKKATRAENTRCMKIARRHGLKVKALMSIGHPGETPGTIRETKEWLLEVKPDDFDATIITCYAGTPYHDDAIPHPTRQGVWVYTYPKTGARLYQLEVDYAKVAEYYKGDPDGGYKAYVFTDELTPEMLVEQRDTLEREVRASLRIPFNQSTAARTYEHSMGQQGRLPPYILRSSETEIAATV